MVYLELTAALSTVLHIRATVLVPSMHVVFTSAKYLSLCFLKVTCFFKAFWETDTKIFPTVSQNRVKTRFTATIKIHEILVLRPHRYSDKIAAVSQSLCGQQDQTLKNLTLPKSMIFYYRHMHMLIFLHIYVTTLYAYANCVAGEDVIHATWACGRKRLGVANNGKKSNKK